MTTHKLCTIKICILKLRCTGGQIVAEQKLTVRTARTVLNFLKMGGPVHIAVELRFPGRNDI